jgi:hypothetical protein
MTPQHTHTKVFVMKELRCIYIYKSRHTHTHHIDECDKKMIIEDKESHE